MKWGVLPAGGGRSGPGGALLNNPKLLLIMIRQVTALGSVRSALRAAGAVHPTGRDRNPSTTPCGTHGRGHDQQPSSGLASAQPRGARRMKTHHGFGRVALIAGLICLPVALSAQAFVRLGGGVTA